MTDHAPRRGAANLSMPLMFVSFIVIAGFLYWLNLQAKAENAADEMMVDSAAAADAYTGTAATITGEDIQQDASPYEGQEVRLAGLAVASPLGTQGFWLELPNKNPFLVSMSEAVKAEGLTVTPGQTADVVGTIHAMSDSVLTAWTSSGAVAEGDRLAAEFATHYLEATHIRFTPGGGAE
jgi:cytoskeletal protein RodZ